MSGYTQHDPGNGISGLGISITGLWNFYAGNYHGDLSTVALTSDQTNPQDFSLPLNANALLPVELLNFKQPFQNGFAGRYGLWMGRISEHLVTEGTTMATQSNKISTDISSYSFGLSVGVEKHMIEQLSKVDAFVASEFVFSVLTGLEYNQAQDIVSDGIKSDSYKSHSEYTVEYPGGFGGSLNLLVGFNYFVFDHLSIGGEAGAGVGFVKIGGDWVSNYTGASTEGQSTTTATMFNNGESDSKLTGLSFNSLGSINLNFYW